MRNRIVSSCSILLTEVVVLSCCLYMLVSFGLLEWVEVNPLLWLVLVLVSYVVNVFLVAKTGSRIVRMIWNLAWIVVSCSLAVMNFSYLPKLMFLQIIVPAVLIGIEVHGSNLALEPPKTENCLLALDVLFVAFVLFLAGSRYRQPGNIRGMILLGFITLVCLVISLILLRTTSGKRRVVEGNASQSRRNLFGLLTGMVVVCGLFCIVLFRAVQQGTIGVRNIFLGLLRGIRQLLYLLERFLYWLAQLLGLGQDEESYLLPKPEHDSFVGTWDGYQNAVLFVVLAVVAIVILCILVKNLNHKPGMKTPTKQYATIFRYRYKGPRIPFLQKLFEWFALRSRMRRNKMTPEGLMVLVKKRGKRIGVMMESKESWQGYIRRIAAYGNRETILELADFIQKYFYRGVGVELTKQQYARFVRAIKSTKRDRTLKNKISKEDLIEIDLREGVLSQKSDTSDQKSLTPEEELEKFQRDVFRKFYV